MKQQITQLTLVVRDYDEAIAFYTQKLGFDLLEDTQMSETKRWVRVAPKGSTTGLLLAKAATPQQEKSIGNQTGGRVFLFLHTDDIDSDYRNLKSEDIKIVREISMESFGKVCVFEDLYGNLWDLIEPTPS